MDRAYLALVEKSFSQDGDFVVIRGIATTPTTDRVGDIIDPMGAEFDLPMKLIMQHDHGLPVGNVVTATPTKKGIPFEARLPIIKEPGRLKDRVDEAIHSLKYDLISAVSVGFKAVADQVERLATGGLLFKRWKWIELSLVTIPANPEAVITAIKAFDTERHAPEGVTGAEEVVSEPAKGPAPAAKRGPVKLIQRKYQS